MNLICDGIWKLLVWHGKVRGAWQLWTLSMNSGNSCKSWCVCAQQNACLGRRQGQALATAPAARRVVPSQPAGGRCCWLGAGQGRGEGGVQDAAGCGAAAGGAMLSPGTSATSRLVSSCRRLSQQRSAPSAPWCPAPSSWICPVLRSLLRRPGRACLAPASGVSSGLADASGSPCFTPLAAEAPGGNSSSSSFLATSWDVFASKAASAVTTATSRPQLKHELRGIFHLCSEAFSTSALSP